MSRGIYLVANRRSERQAANLVHTLRQSGCALPIALIPYDDDLPRHPALLAETTPMPVESFPAEGRAILDEIRRLWPRTSAGLLRRFLAFYGPYDEFIYTDNDIVALGDWAPYFEPLPDYDLVHADQEFQTGGRYNYRDPAALQREFGDDALESALTAGHFAARKRPDMTELFRRAIAWIERHPEIAMPHDQAFLHLAILLGQLRTLNFCRPPHDWPSTWAADYSNTLAVTQRAQGPGRLLHLHYSGGTSNGYAAVEDFCYADCSNAGRMRHLVRAALVHGSGLHTLRRRVWPALKRRFWRT
jgi:hypothetical protein